MPPHSTSSRAISILFSPLRLGVPSCLFPSGLLIKTPHAPLLSPICATYEHLTLILQRRGSNLDVVMFNTFFHLSLRRDVSRPKIFAFLNLKFVLGVCRSQWPHVLRRMSATSRLLRLWVRIPPGAWTSVCCECCVLSGRGLCDELITRPEESYRVWCVVCDLETS